MPLAFCFKPHLFGDLLRELAQLLQICLANQAVTVDTSLRRSREVAPFGVVPFNRGSYLTPGFLDTRVSNQPIRDCMILHGL